MPSRRDVLGTIAVGLAATLAGCVDPAGVLGMSGATTDEIVHEATRNVDPAEEPDEAELLDTVLEDGTATTEGRRPPLEADRPISFRGRVYDVSITEVGERTRTEYTIELDFDPPDTDGQEIEFEELPTVDREVIEPLLELEPPSPREGIDVGTRRYYTDEERASSVLVPEQEVAFVVVDDERVRVSTEPTAVTVTEYRYTVAELADGYETYADELQETYRFTLDGLTDDERDVVETAIEERRYYASSSSDEAFEGVARAFLEHEPVTNDGYEGGWLVRYEGTTYWAAVHFIQYGELREKLAAME